MSDSTSIYDFKIKNSRGEIIDFNQYRDKVLLIVNTASKCGFTSQYEGLQQLYDKYETQDLVVLGFPCNQFLKQEPDGNELIQQNCFINFGVSFSIFEKIDVNGKNAHPLFKFLKVVLPGIITNDIKWNFTKFLIDRNGKPLKRFAPITTPEKIDIYCVNRKIFV